MNLYKASNQWSNRPDDERFWTVTDLVAATKSYRDSAREGIVNPRDLRVEALEGEVRLIGEKKIPARLTHWAFGQLASLVNAPANYLRKLPATLAAQNLNHGLAKQRVTLDGDGFADTLPIKVLAHENGDLIIRALNGEKYGRIWNHDIATRLLALEDRGWRVPPARPAPNANPATVRLATEADVLRVRDHGLSINVGDPIAPAGLYASDHDFFAFMVNEDSRIAEPGNPSGLSRGFFTSNSEVGGGKFRLWTFLYRNVCGNHIIWGAEEVAEFSVIHVGDNAADKAFKQWSVELVKYSNASASDDEARIRAAKTFQIAGTKDDLLDRLFGMKSLNVSRKTLSAAYDAAEEHTDTDGSPRSAWGFAQGLTRVSQDHGFAEDRVALDRAAGKVIQLAF